MKEKGKGGRKGFHTERGQMTEKIQIPYEIDEYDPERDDAPEGGPTDCSGEGEDDGAQ